MLNRARSAFKKGRSYLSIGWNGVFLIGVCNRFTRCVGTVILTTLLAVCPSVFAQSNPKETVKWELKLFSGFSVYHGTAGSRGLPPPGHTYTVFIRPVLYDSRSVPSWLFGDGTGLFNAAADRVGAVPKITPLDPVLTSSVVQPPATSVGLRLSRKINRWAAVEFSLERSGVFTLSDRAGTGIQASRDSFAPAFRAVTRGLVDSQSVIKERGGFMALSTGSSLSNCLGTAGLSRFW